MAFDAEAFVAACRGAADDADPVAAVHEIVAAAIVDGSSIDAALGTEFLPGTVEPPLLSSEDLTIQRILWPPGISVMPHEHRMWAVVGVYAGEELNRIYERSTDGLTEVRRCAVAPREVLVLDEHAIHSVENLCREWTAGLHVYGGDMLHRERSAWGPDGREVSSDENTAAYAQMIQGMYQLAADHGERIDAEARYLANRALVAWWERERRYPTPAEARGIIANAWQVEA
jgi:predicted metal-dependent enzyme (double-stranded beta helix superfamily)